MSEKRKRRSAVSFKDVQIAYLCSGISPIEQMHNRRLASASTIRRALHQLKCNGTPAEPLEKWFHENFGPGTRGRAAPQAGQERIYRAQQIKTSGTFLRLPLAALSIGKGEVVTVKFEKDKIVVKKV
ncbi:MAG: hypothetical protein KC505_01515 [Myxococcales bacterium]|nr:hypothetical protein [Myxococcales bacterium]USN51777.1 MAG: hypothetical protein H6731_05055 [Myxococcales bacterium]